MFGEGYSGLEYDYRGLLKLYRSTDNLAMADHYHDILHQWNTIRDLNNAAEVKPLEFSISVDFEETVKKYFSWLSKLPECFISPRVCVQWCGRKSIDIDLSHSIERSLPTVSKQKVRWILCAIIFLFIQYCCRPYQGWLLFNRESHAILYFIIRNVFLHFEF